MIASIDINGPEGFTMTDKLILYHANCPDGFTSMWVAYRALMRWWHNQDITEGSIPPNIECVPMHYKQPPPDVTGKDVYICDFSFPRTMLQEMHFKAERLVVLDHHKTAQQDLEGLEFCVFDMNRSGAGITWDYFHNGNEPGPRPWLVEYIQDRDLWTWKLPNSRQICDAISSRPLTLEAWDEMAAMPTPDLLDVEGQAIGKYKTTVIDSHIKQAYITEFEGYEVPAVNASTLNSELGNILSKNYPFAVAWSYLGEGIFRYSLRATSNVDVSAICKKYGGGGHAAAAGFTSKEFLVPAIRPFERGE